MKHTKSYKILIFIFIIFIVTNHINYANNQLAVSNVEIPSNDLLMPSSNINNSTLNNVLSENTISDPRAAFENITATSCILIDVDSGIILYNKNAYEKTYPASTTKLITALLVLENCQLNDNVVVSHYAVHSVPATYSISNLKPGETFTVKDLLYTLLIGSANDSAFVLAQYVANGGNNYPIDNSQDAQIAFKASIQKFSNMMNNLAQKLGCKSTNFVNPNGIHDDNHVSTAYDLSLIGIYAYKNPILMEIVSAESYELPNSNIYQGEVRKCKCTNLLLYNNLPSYYEYANGLKTGYTDAARSCIVASAKKDDLNLIAVVLGADKPEAGETSRENICKILFDYGFNNYFYTDLIKSNDVATTLNVINGNRSQKSLDLIVKDNIRALVKKDEFHDITPNIKIKNFLAPIGKNSVIGSITYKINGLTYSSDLLASHDVEPADYTYLIFVLSFIVLIFLAGLVIVIIRTKSTQK